MLRWLGAGLILCGGLLTRRTLLDGARRAQQTRRAFAAAFEAIEAEIRLLLTPMPALLRRSYSGDADTFFAEIAKRLSRGGSLAQAWRQATESLPLPPDEREALAALGQSLGGSEESVCAALTLAASMLRKRYEAVEGVRPQNERLTTSICISACLFLVILLF